MKTQIDKGIPIPTDLRAEFVKVLRKCEVGDSFAWSKRHRTNLHAASQKINVAITVREIDADNYRVWRIK